MEKTIMIPKIAYATQKLLTTAKIKNDDRLLLSFNNIIRCMKKYGMYAEAQDLNRKYYDIKIENIEKRMAKRMIKD